MATVAVTEGKVSVACMHVQTIEERIICLTIRRKTINTPGELGGTHDLS